MDTSDWESRDLGNWYKDQLGNGEPGAFHLFCSFICFVFWLCLAACGVLVPWPGVEPMLPAVEAPGPDHWTSREVPGGIHLQITRGQGKRLNKEANLPAPLTVKSWNRCRSGDVGPQSSNVSSGRGILYQSVLLCWLLRQPSEATNLHSLRLRSSGWESLFPHRFQ